MNGTKYDHANKIANHCYIKNFKFAILKVNFTLDSFRLHGNCGVYYFKK